MFERISAMDLLHILQFSFDKDKNASRTAEYINSAYGPVTVAVKLCTIYDFVLVVKNDPRGGRPMDENI